MSSRPTNPRRVGSLRGQPYRGSCLAPELPRLSLTDRCETPCIAAETRRDSVKLESRAPAKVTKMTDSWGNINQAFFPISHVFTVIGTVAPCFCSPNQCQASAALLGSRYARENKYTPRAQNAFSRFSAIDVRVWCLPPVQLGFSTHRKKRMRQLKRQKKSGLASAGDPSDDPFELFVNSTNIRFAPHRCLYIYISVSRRVSRLKMRLVSWRLNRRTGSKLLGCARGL